MNNIKDLPINIYERLEYLEFMLRFRGWFSRLDLKDRFGISDAAATRDISHYRKSAKNKDEEDLNVTFNQVTKKYEIKDDTFFPLFDISINHALSKIRNPKICEALDMGECNGVLAFPRLSIPKLDDLSNITRAISNEHTLKVDYHSVGNGHSTKKLLPHSIFDNGIHWYMRAYDLEKEKFRSYALTRIVASKIIISDEIKANKSSKSRDESWNRIVNLEIVPHPNRKNVKNPETIALDFNMENGVLKLPVRAAVAGFWLAMWTIDCTKDHSLEGYQYQLWLRNHDSLYDVDSRSIAPGLSDYNKND
ncbi:helix-turn-helix transcriptional regulator [Shewanella atlantica]|uniref:WYL domain-containing protein n=1 Tax=Shewanella atlantica TaxID=271099 RepID=A0A3S0KH29_9GAMM|nr:WYL domain-containing protein [Shewanella atlantica]RTR30663.1 WYL domain-containing protein [Shewanella atlantica]